MTCGKRCIQNAEKQDLFAELMSTVDFTPMLPLQYYSREEKIAPALQALVKIIYCNHKPLSVQLLTTYEALLYMLPLFE